MCGIFGIVSKTGTNKIVLNKLAVHASQRGKDSSGLLYLMDGRYKVERADYKIQKLMGKIKPYNSEVVVGHSRLITNGLSDNQPVIGDHVSVFHNGIIVNEVEAWSKTTQERKLRIDTEIIAAIADEHISQEQSLMDLPRKILSICRGVVACAIVVPSIGKILLFSNNGSLYAGDFKGSQVFASESHSLADIGCVNILQVKDKGVVFDIPEVKSDLDVTDTVQRIENLIPELLTNATEESMLEYRSTDLTRCSRCILPETMPFIYFDGQGVCNYCLNHRARNEPKSKQELFDLVEPYRRPGELDCIVPFSGGRDSCYALHLIVNELKMTPITYTYDWGMVTDLGRRNISQMCGDMGIENIIIAADISKKRENIKKNLKAWLKSPHLGMMAMLTAGDKHFFRHVETVKKQTGIDLNIWGVNSMETTHFKTGFLGIKPDFEEDKVYSNGIAKQFRYHSKRFRTMTESPGYFNASLVDTLSGEYYRSFTKKSDYYHIFDYWQWNEAEVNDILINKYDWETASDTSSTWRIGDGTAGFYNYVYRTVAGFTEHDTFRSNQVREGQLTRMQALALVEDENRPRYQNIRWYLDTLNLDFSEVIGLVNEIPKMYKC